VRHPARHPGKHRPASPWKRGAAILPAVLFAAFIVTIIRIADSGDGDRWWGFVNDMPFGDKLGHLVLMTLLSLLFNLAFPPRRTDGYRRALTTTTLVLLILTTGEEISQAFNPHRTCDLIDWLANVAGLWLGQLAAKGRKK
jgi:polysaccharide biosynthesis protein VpsQ